MTIQNTTRKAGPFTNATESPITGPFAFGFKIFALTNLKVVKSASASATGATTTLTYGTDYTVTADLSAQDTTPGGSITLIGTAKLEPGYYLTILSNIDYSQLTKLTNYDRFMPDTLNDVHDKTVALVQQLKEQNDRTVTVPATSSTSPDEYIDEIFTARDTAVTKATEAAGSAQTATNKANEVTAKYNLISPHFTAIDGVYADRANLDTVATNINNVNSVGTNIGAVNNVHSNMAVVTAVSGNATNINTVASDKTNIDKVATVYTKVDILANYTTEISTVSTNIANVNAVGSNIGNVNAVAGNETNINAVKNNSSNINTVSTNINNVNSVGSSIANVNTVATNISSINAVNSDLESVVAVAEDLTNIDAASGHAQTASTKATEASNSAADAKTYAIGYPAEPVGGHSAKYYSEHMALSYKGEYNVATTYGMNSFVKSVSGATNSYYISLVDNNVGNPLTDTSKWELLFTVDAGVLGVFEQNETISTASETPQSFTLQAFSKLLVYIDGVMATQGVSFNVTNTTVTFTSVLPIGTEVKFIRFTGANSGSISVATTTELGVIKVGNGLSVTSDGKLSTTFQVPNTAEAHNCVYRGKEHTVESLSEMVQAGDFSDIFIGDYITVSFTWNITAGTSITVTNEKVRVAAINYYKNSGVVSNDHLIMIPSTTFGAGTMNSTNTTVGGYAGCDMDTTYLVNLATALKATIGSSHVVSHTIGLTTEMTAATPSMAGSGTTGAATNHGNNSVDVCLMSEPMVYGGCVFSSSAIDVDERCAQLPIFSLNPQMIALGGSASANWWWLSAIADSARFACVNCNGRADARNASYSRGIRPYFVFR